MVLPLLMLSNGQTQILLKSKITFEEQLTTAIHDLASAIKNNNLHLLPNHDLRENINQLESLFRTSVEYITRKKLTPLAPERTGTDLKPLLQEMILLQNFQGC